MKQSFEKKEFCRSRLPLLLFLLFTILFFGCLYYHRSFIISSPKEGLEYDCRLTYDEVLVELKCNGGVFHKVAFASYGTPTGSCRTGFTTSTCHSSTSAAVVAALCVGKSYCQIAASIDNFGDPCVGTVKQLAVVVEGNCSNPLPSIEPYADLNGGSYVEALKNDLSHDPLINYVWDYNKTNDVDLQVFPVLPTRLWVSNPDSFENINSLLQPNASVLVTGDGKITLDFGVDNPGWLELEIDESDYKSMNKKNFSGPQNFNLQLCISEYNDTEIVNYGVTHTVKCDTPQQYGNIFRLETTYLLYEGVRFGFVNITGVSIPFRITSIRCMTQTKVINYLGSFNSSDPLLSRIWYTAVYAVRANLERDYLSVILTDRSDRFAWAGDAHVSQAVSLIVFNNYPFIRNNQEQLACDDCSQGIESYSLYWIFSLFDYFYYSGDNDYLIGHIPTVIKRLDRAYSIYGKNPNLGFFGHDERLGATFENPNVPESQKAYCMLVIRASQQFGEALALVNNASLSKKYLQIASDLMTQLRSDPKWWESFGLHASADALNTGLTTEEENQQIIDNSFSDWLNICSRGPGNGFFIIRSLAQIGRYSLAMDIIRECWGGQIHLGGTCFWEVYTPQWLSFVKPNGFIPNGQSGYATLCQPWCSGPAKWLSDYSLGLTPILPGWAQFSWKPALGSNMTFVEGSVPTPRGVLYAKYSADVKCPIPSASSASPSSPSTCSGATLRVVHGTKAKIAFPKNGKQIQTILHQNVVIFSSSSSSHGPSKKIYHIEDSRDYVYVSYVGEGEHHFIIEYTNHVDHLSVLSKRTVSYNYPGQYIGQDRVTQGNWKGKYGSLGQVFFAFNTSDYVALKKPFLSVTSLPTGSRGKPVLVSTNSSDSRVLLSPSTYPGRRMGAIQTQNPIACAQTFPVDVITQPTNSSKGFQIAAYVCDYESLSRIMVIETFDLQTKNIMAPFVQVVNFTECSYIIFRYYRSFRIRFSFMRGGDSLVNALFFDP